MSFQTIAMIVASICGTIIILLCVAVVLLVVLDRLLGFSYKEGQAKAKGAYDDYLRHLAKSFSHDFPVQMLLIDIAKDESQVMIHRNWIKRNKDD